MDCTKKLHDDIGDIGDIANIATFATTKKQNASTKFGRFPFSVRALTMHGRPVAFVSGSLCIP